MFIAFSGHHTLGTFWNSKGDVQIAVAVASVTFSGLDGPVEFVNAVSMIWKNPTTGQRRLDLLMNGAAPPAGSVMVRRQWNISLNIPEDLSLTTNFGMADLEAGVVDTEWQGVCHFETHAQGVARFVYGEGFARDGTLSLGDRLRQSTRHGRWNSIVDDITSVTIQASGGGNPIGPGSDIRCYSMKT